MSDLSSLAAAGSFEAQVQATFERFVADYVDPHGGEPVSPAVVGAVFAAILPVMNPTGATAEFGRAIERTARERIPEPVSLLREPLEEILNLIRPGHVWQFGTGTDSVFTVPAQLPRSADEAASAGR